MSKTPQSPQRRVKAAPRAANHPAVQSSPQDATGSGTAPAILDAALRAGAALSPRQVKCIDSLLRFGSVTRAAQAASVSRKTVHQWMQSPRFRGALAELQSNLLASSATHITRLGLLATDSLEELLQDGDPKLRLRAVEIYFARVLSFYDHVQNQQRLAALEAHLERVEQPPQALT
jgi:hypothetical protein